MSIPYIHWLNDGGLAFKTATVCFVKLLTCSSHQAQSAIILTPKSHASTAISTWFPSIPHLSFKPWFWYLLDHVGMMFHIFHWKQISNMFIDFPHRKQSCPTRSLWDPPHLHHFGGVQNPTVVAAEEVDRSVMGRPAGTTPARPAGYHFFVHVHSFSMELNCWFR